MNLSNLGIILSESYFIFKKSITIDEIEKQFVLQIIVEDCKKQLTATKSSLRKK